MVTRHLRFYQIIGNRFITFLTCIHRIIYSFTNIEPQSIRIFIFQLYDFQVIGNHEFKWDHNRIFLHILRIRRIRFLSPNRQCIGSRIRYGVFLFLHTIPHKGIGSIIRSGIFQFIFKDIYLSPIRVRNIGAHIGFTSTNSVICRHFPHHIGNIIRQSAYCFGQFKKFKRR